MRELDTDGSIVSWAMQQQADKLAGNFTEARNANEQQTDQSKQRKCFELGSRASTDQVGLIVRCSPKSAKVQCPRKWHSSGSKVRSGQ